MGKTYRKNKDGEMVSDGGRHTPKPRYRAGSRTKKRTITAVGVRREDPDLEMFGRAALRAALLEAEREAAANGSQDAGAGDE